jgi:beta-xylosidase
MYYSTQVLKARFAKHVFLEFSKSFDHEMFFQKWNDENPDLWKLNKIYIQTVDQAYRHGLLSRTEFSDYIQRWACSRRAAVKNVCKYFAKFGKENKKNLFGNNKILSKGWHSSPFGNIEGM